MKSRVGAALLAAVLIATLSACWAPGAQMDKAVTPPQLRVLFVGNSLTYYNDLPAKFATLHRASFPRTLVQTEMLAKGGASLRDRLRDDSLKTALATGRFDVVVLQDFGGWPLCSTKIPACEAGSQSLREAVTLVRRHGAHPVWFATWLSPELQPRLSEASADVATEVGVDWIDVGDAVRKASRLGPVLLQADGHPAPDGSWLAAMTLLQHLQPGAILPARGDVTSCGRIWQGTGLRGDVLASKQPVRTEHCDRLDQATLRTLRKALD